MKGRFRPLFARMFLSKLSNMLSGDNLRQNALPALPFCVFPGKAADKLDCVGRMPPCTSRAQPQRCRSWALGLVASLWFAELFAKGFLGDMGTPDLSGQKRKAAAQRLAEARMALEEAQELQASGASSGLWYQVVTEGEDGIGIRKTADLKGERVEDLVKGSVFEVDDIVQNDGEPIFLHLKDGRGWVFDLTPVDPETPTVKRLEGVYANGKTLPELEAEVQQARLDLDRIRGARRVP